MSQVPEGNGSGIVWDGEGHIVTNYHGEPQVQLYIPVSRHLN